MSEEGRGAPPGLALNGQSYDYFAGALDVVSHEWTHAVTDSSSDLVYLDEPGALNEAFSDVMSAGAEFFFQERGDGPLKGDWLHAEDAAPPAGCRSFEDPGRFGHPDHYSRRFLGTQDNGGVHINSGVANHAFYLAVEGGRNRTSGLSVQAVGFAARDQIEKAFYRGFVHMLTPQSGFRQARAAALQAARELHGAASPAERAIAQALVGRGRRVSAAMRGQAKRARLAGALLALAAGPGPAAAAQDRVRLALDTGWASRDQAFDVTNSYPGFAQTTRVSAHHAAGSSKQLAGEVQVRVWRRVGVAPALAGSDTRGSAAVQASVPHPLYLNSDRSVSAEVSNLPYSENAVHADVVALHASGPWRLRAFAGLSFFSVKTRVVERISYRHAYPYDEAEFTGATPAPADGSATGFNLGAGADWQFTPQFGLGVQARFARASVDLATQGGTSLTLEPGGLVLSAAARLVF